MGDTEKVKRRLFSKDEDRAIAEIYAANYPSLHRAEVLTKSTTSVACAEIWDKIQEEINLLMSVPFTKKRDLRSKISKCKVGLIAKLRYYFVVFYLLSENYGIVIATNFACSFQFVYRTLTCVTFWIC